MIRQPIFPLLLSLALLFVVPFGPAGARHLKLAPFKNDLFAYPQILEKKFGSAYLRVDYDKQRDVYARDEIPRRRVKRNYVNQRVRWSRRIMRYASAGGSKKMFAVGRHKGGAKITVIYLYGQGGNRFQGVNDWTFGGNFNRLQNLMVRNDGLLLTPDYSGFDDAGAADILALMTEYRVKSPNTVMIVACGSMGGAVCWKLLANNGASAQIDGMFMLGTTINATLINALARRKTGRQIPLYFGHGSDDVVFDAGTQQKRFSSLKKQNPAYPARFVMFNSGVHGTPIRMVDWWRELNWMLAQHP